MRTGIWWESDEVRKWDHLEELSVEGRIVLK